MPITRLNHAVLYVRDAQRSADFYTGVLGFRRLPVAEGTPGAAFLQAPGSTNDHDLGLFSVGEAAGDSARGAARAQAAGRGVGLYHLAWEVDTLAELERLAGVLAEHRALVGASDHGSTKSLYGRDVDGIEFEIAWIVPADRLDQVALEGRSSIQPLDIAKEMQRYGADTPGGVGISSPAAV